MPFEDTDREFFDMDPGGEVLWYQKKRAVLLSEANFLPLSTMAKVDEYLYDDDGVMVVGNEGRILFVGSTVPGEYSQNQVINTQHLIVPGFVDAHVHYPQLPVIASYGASSLNGWTSTRSPRR